MELFAHKNGFIIYELTKKNKNKNKTGKRQTGKILFWQAITARFIYLKLRYWKPCKESIKPVLALTVLRYRRNSTTIGKSHQCSQLRRSRTDLKSFVVAVGLNNPSLQHIAKIDFVLGPLNLKWSNTEKGKSNYKSMIQNCILKNK